MLELSRKISKAISFFLRPVDLLGGVFFFTVRYFLFGIDSANKYLEKVSKPAIIPILRLFGAKIGKNCDIQTGLIFHNCYNFKNVEVGNNCHIGKNCFFDLRDKILIEDNVVISMQCTLITHIDMTKSELSQQYPASKAPIKIGKNAYIGVKACILMGVEIGINSFIGAKSLVTRNVADYSRVGGIPAKEIKSKNLK